MDSGPIIGGNWATTEPRYRKPLILPNKGKLHILTDTELDTLDALSILGRASSYLDLFPVLKFAYDESTIRKCLYRLESLRCIDIVERTFEFPGPGMKPKYYRINQNGMDAMNETLDALEARMMERGGSGIRRKRKCS